MTDVQDPHEQRNGSLHTELANAVVGLVREYTGRGPTRARVAISGELVTVLMGDLLTKAERKLVEDGKGGLVLEVRKEFQRTMREDLIAAVEGLTGRTVIAFMSDNHIDPDMAVESFVLEPEVEAQP
jgi:uncharacterized protein YbcI